VAAALPHVLFAILQQALAADENSWNIASVAPSKAGVSLDWRASEQLPAHSAGSAQTARVPI
jgi:hypothetical protein